MLVNGAWQDNWHPVQSKDERGRFKDILHHFVIGSRPMELPGSLVRAALKHKRIDIICM